MPRDGHPHPRSRSDAPGPKGLVLRPRLISAMLEAERPLCVIDAPAGMGKSLLLEMLAEETGSAVIRSAALGPQVWGLLVWDLSNLPVAGEVPAEFGQGTRLILAKRPETAVPGLARARVYGRVAEFGTEDLLFDEGEISEGFGLGPEAAARMMQQTGGWPCLVRALAAGDGSPPLEEFLRSEILAALSGPQLVGLEALLAGHATAGGERLLAGLPFVDPLRPSPLHPVLEAVREPMLHALQAERSARMTSVPAVRAIAVAQAALDRSPLWIVADPPWHTDAVGGRSHHQRHLRLDNQDELIGIVKDMLASSLFLGGGAFQFVASDSLA